MESRLKGVNGGSAVAGDGGTTPQPCLGKWPEDGLEHLDRCPVCHGASRKLLYEGLTDRVFFCAPGSWTLWECSSCRCAYLDPRPDEATIGLAYSSYYTHSLCDDPWRSDVAGPWHLKARRALVNGYRNWKMGSQLRPAAKAGIPLLWLLPGARERLDRGVYYLPAHKRGGKVLDIGCGSGAFLRKARHVGWEVAGAEPDPDAAAAGAEEGLGVRQGFVDSFSDMEGRFDVVTASHVVEHVHDPRALLSAAFRLLKPGGQLFVDTPNLSSLAHQRFGSSWFSLDPPRHLILFHWAILESTLREIGFSQLSRFPAIRGYGGIAKASKAIRTNESLSSGKEVFIPDWIANSFARWRTRVNYKNSEFVTLLAFKPSK